MFLKEILWDSYLWNMYFFLYKIGHIFTWRASLFPVESWELKNIFIFWVISTSFVPNLYNSLKKFVGIL